MTPERTAAVASTPAASLPEAEPQSAATRKPRFDSAYVAPLFITSILLAGHLGFGVLESPWKTLLAIATAIAAEIVLHRVFFSKWPHLASAYITGISVGIILRSPAFWPYALCSLISITSKYVLRVKGRHLWNPSNFGISVILFLAASDAAALSVQWGNQVWAMAVIWGVGSVIIWRLRRFHICATYVASFIALSYVRSLFTGHTWLTEMTPITGPPYQLFVFFMITDPKTTVKSKWGQCIVAFAVALAEMILRLNQEIHAPYYALFLVGPAANLIEIWWNSRRPIGGTLASSAA